MPTGDTKTSDPRSSIVAALARVLGIQPTAVRRRAGARGPDVLLAAGGHTFHVLTAGRGDLLAVQAALYRGAHALAASGAIPVVAALLMGRASTAFLEQQRIGWFDLAGNASITAPGLRISIVGRTAPMRPRGRPRDAFAPKRARVSHTLLLDPGKAWRQKDLAEATGLDAGYVSRTVRVLDEAALIERDASGVRPRDAAAYFEAWRDAYRFSEHRVLRGHVGAPSGEALCRLVADHAGASSLRHAFTALPAAFYLSAFGGFRLVTAYLDSLPSPEWLAGLRFRDDPRGANLWLVVPKDQGVFLGSREVAGLTCASPVQVSLDLKDHPERSGDADAEVRRQVMPWSVRRVQASARI